MHFSAILVFGLTCVFHNAFVTSFITDFTTYLSSNNVQEVNLNQSSGSGLEGRFSVWKYQKPEHIIKRYSEIFGKKLSFSNFTLVAGFRPYKRKGLLFSITDPSNAVTQLALMYSIESKMSRGIKKEKVTFLFFYEPNWQNMAREVHTTNEAVRQRGYNKVTMQSEKFIVGQHWLFLYMSINSNGKIAFEFACPQSDLFQIKESIESFDKLKKPLIFSPGSNVNILSASGREPFHGEIFRLALIDKTLSQNENQDMKCLPTLPPQLASEDSSLPRTESTEGSGRNVDEEAFPEKINELIGSENSYTETTPVPLIINFTPTVDIEKGEESSTDTAVIKAKTGDNGDEGDIGTAERNRISGQKGDKGDIGTTGINGKPGEKGDKGDIGTTGNNGKPGEKGDKGAFGTTGNNGKPGEKGDKGDIGPTGINGKIGEKGDKGDIGTAGTNGKTGQKGDKGDIGTAGINGMSGQKGVKGDIGIAGKNGISGQKGDKGDIGTAGINGMSGQKGDKGDVGIAGTIGKTGGKGDKGEIGARGLIGKPGKKGEEGGMGICRTSQCESIFSRLAQKGEKGADGVCKETCKVPFVPTANSQSGAVGEQGFKGDAGDQGPKGNIGATGLKGDQGEPGNPGSMGSQGLPGIKGEMGPPGLKGEPGEPGKQSSENKPIASGKDGVKGEKGEDGKTGSDGINGSKGDQGIKGEKGDSGASGKKGDRGASGTVQLDQIKLVVEEYLKNNYGSLGKGLKGEPGKNGAPGECLCKNSNEEEKMKNPANNFVNPSQSGALFFRNMRTLESVSAYLNEGTLAYCKISQKFLLKTDFAENEWQEINLQSALKLNKTTAMKFKPRHPNVKSKFTRPSRNGSPRQLRLVALTRPRSAGVKDKFGNVGILSADYMCQREALKFGLSSTRFMSLLSGTRQIIDGLVQQKNALSTPIVNLKGEKLFNNWKELISGEKFNTSINIQDFNDINVTEWIQFKESARICVWHGATKLTLNESNDNTCQEWTSSASSHLGLSSDMKSGELLSTTPQVCSQKCVILCIETD